MIVSSTGADYVFDPNYKLQPLSEVAAYVRENHHPPDIPSAAEGKEKGVSLGHMQAKLPAKVEEPTLHMIETEKKIDRLAAENLKLQKELDEMKAEQKKENRNGSQKR